MMNKEEVDQCMVEIRKAADQLEQRSRDQAPSRMRWLLDLLVDIWVIASAF